MKRRVFGVAVSLAAVVAAMLTVVPTAEATPPGCNGRVAFMRQDAQGFWQTWVANADLTRQKQVTDLAANSGWAVWSPDGKKLAVDSDRGDANPGGDTSVNDIVVMNADGSGVKNLTRSLGYYGDPAWSPNGSLIAFGSNGGADPARRGIYVMRPDGSHPRQITTRPAGDAYEGAPRFSPDGKQLVFTRVHTEQGFGSSALFRVDLDGRHLRQLTSFAIGAGDSDWSPDGRHIVFEAYPTADSHGEIDVIRSTGGHVRTLRPNFSADPVWAPDGSRILYTQGVPGEGTFTEGLATMKPDGSRQRFVSPTPMVEHQPDWESVSRGRHCS
jgi:Tol biopolymer transport system component